MSGAIDRTRNDRFAEAPSTLYDGAVAIARRRVGGEKDPRRIGLDERLDDHGDAFAPARGSLRTRRQRRDGREWVVVDVIDTGRGIPAHIRDKIFNLYFSTRQDGSGLGLSTSKRITEEHGRVGSLLSLAEDSQYNLESRNLAMIETLSKLGDADLSETLMLYENAEASYQASLLLASNIYQLTLASFL